LLLLSLLVRLRRLFSIRRSIHFLPFLAPFVQWSCCFDDILSGKVLLVASGEELKPFDFLVGVELGLESTGGNQLEIY
jgi:hypothetical protein